MLYKSSEKIWFSLLDPEMDTKFFYFCPYHWIRTSVESTQPTNMKDLIYEGFYCGRGL